MRTPGLGALLFRLLTTKPSIRYFLNMNFNDRAPDDMVQYATRSAHRKGARYAPIAFLSGTLFATDAPATLYAPLELPALILYDQDPNVSFARLPQFIAENANWQALRVAPTQGLPHFEQTTEVVAILQRFWATDS
jgi:pimeloyl-ACP methyl ester carboxylesterase